jgi:hypothetical protein
LLLGNVPVLEKKGFLFVNTRSVPFLHPGFVYFFVTSKKRV